MSISRRPGPGKLEDPPLGAVPDHPLLVDLSACDSCAFLIEADLEERLAAGFRATGRLALV